MLIDELLSKASAATYTTTIRVCYALNMLAGRRVSLVPFVLRWLQADLAEESELMYRLLDYCTQQLTHQPDLASTMKNLQATQRLHSISLRDDDFAAPDASGNAESEPEQHVRIWARRQHMVVCNLVNRHVR